MKLLVVDDLHTKVEAISQAVKKSGVSVDITHETNASSARKRLREEEFDLLLIDLQLPASPGARPNQYGGIEFFDLLIDDYQASLPLEILFVTGEDSLVANGRKEIELRGSALCVIAVTSDSWMEAISGQIKLAQKRANRKICSYDVSVITALGSELEAVLSLDYKWERFRLSGDPTLYYKGAFNTSSGERTIVAASALRKGMAASSALATKLVLKFRPKLLAMTGICAGVKTDVGLGDVIVGSPTWDWGSGKYAEDDNGSAVFKLSPKQSDLSTELIALCDEIGRSGDFRRKVRANWDKNLPEGELRCHIGPMASGASVIANASIAKEVASQNRDVIAVEMEAFAVMVAAEYASSSSLDSIAIKSVCDFADKDKHDGWQSYAAYTSAQYADELFQRYFSD